MGFLTVLTYVLLSFLVGIFLITLPSGIVLLPNYLRHDAFSGLPFSSRIALILTGFVVILLCLRYIQKMVSGSRKNKSISFESKEGEVNITLVAIEDMLKKMLESRDEVSHTKVKVGLKKKMVEVKIKGYLNYQVNLVDFTRDIQEKVKEKLQVLLGQDKKVQVNLQIRKIAVSEENGQDKEQDPEIPFRNYE